MAGSVDCADLLTGTATAVTVRPPSVRLSRWFLVYMASMHVLFAWGTGKAHDPGIWAVWPLLFVLAAACCAWAAIDFASQPATCLAAAATVTAFASRSGLFVLSWSYGIADFTDSRIILGFGVWALAAVLSSIVFTRCMAPLSARLRREK